MPSVRLTANITPLTAHMFGMRDLHVAIALTCWFEPLAGLGATVAWLMHVQNKEQGSGSYDSFMFMCSGIAGVAAVMVRARPPHPCPFQLVCLSRRRCSCSSSMIPTSGGCWHAKCSRQASTARGWRLRQGPYACGKTKTRARGSAQLPSIRRDPAHAERFAPSSTGGKEQQHGSCMLTMPSTLFSRFKKAQLRTSSRRSREWRLMCLPQNGLSHKPPCFEGAA
jgi:hypothetical protein